MGKHDVQYPFALDQNNRLVCIQDVNDRSARFTCHVCGSVMIPAQGKVNRWHFRHETDSPCDPDKYWHTAAQRRLRQVLENMILGHGPTPVVRRYRTGFSFFTSSFRRELSLPFNTDEVQLEFDVPTAAIKDRRRIDVALLLEGMAVLFIEVRHTHAVDSQKRQDLAGTGIPWLEVDAQQVAENPLYWDVLNEGNGALAISEDRVAQVGWAAAGIVVTTKLVSSILKATRPRSWWDRLFR